MCTVIFTDTWTAKLSLLTKRLERTFGKRSACTDVTRAFTAHYCKNRSSRRNRASEVKAEISEGESRTSSASHTLLVCAATQLGRPFPLPQRHSLSVEMDDSTREVRSTKLMATSVDHGGTWTGLLQIATGDSAIIDDKWGSITYTWTVQ